MEEMHWGWIRKQEREGERKREGEIIWLRIFPFSFSLLSALTQRQQQTHHKVL